MNSYKSILAQIVFWIQIWIHISDGNDAELKEISDMASAIGSEMSFKTILDPKEMECYTEVVGYDNQVYFSYTVVKGADRKIDVYIRGEHQVIVARHDQQASGYNEFKCESHGGCEYKICFDNTFSRFTTKHTEIQVMSWRSEDLTSYEQDNQQFGLTADQSIKAANAISRAGMAMRRYFTASRGILLVYNSMAERTWAAVNNFSMFLCVLIVVTSAIQVYFVKRLFKLPPNKTRV